MHPEILRLVNEQRGHELRTRAHQARLARMIKSARRGRGLADEAELVIPPIPDYVDGSFRTEGTGVLSADTQAASGTGHAATAHA